MKFEECGRKDALPVLILENSSNGLTQQIDKLAANYRVIVPVQEENSANCINDAAEIEDYVKNQLNGSLYALCSTLQNWSVVRSILSGGRINPVKVIVENEAGTLMMPELEEAAKEKLICNRR